MLGYESVDRARPLTHHGTNQPAEKEAAISVTLGRPLSNDGEGHALGLPKDGFEFWEHERGWEGLYMGRLQ